MFYKKTIVPYKLKWRDIQYFFQQNSFLELYEDNEFLDEILNDTADVFIDVGANIGRISSLVAAYNHWYKKIIALEPNTNCIQIWLKYIPNKIKKRIDFKDYGLWDKTDTCKMTIHSTHVTTTRWTLHEEKSPLQNRESKDKQKINVKILSFNDFFEENKLYEYKTFIMKIDVEWYEEYVLKSFFEFINKNNWKYIFKVIIEILDCNYDLFEKLEQFWIDKKNIKQLWTSDDYLFQIK